MGMLGWNPMEKSQYYLYICQMEEKICVRCKQSLPVSEFYERTKKSSKGQQWSYYDSHCRRCRGKYHSERRRSYKERAIAYLGGKCQDCGYRDRFPEVYDFHHLDPTTKDFDVFNTPKPFHRIKEELDKCILLCANCHRKRHANWNTK